MSDTSPTPVFTILDEDVPARRNTGNNKKALTVAIENLTVGQTLSTGLSVGDFESSSADYKRIMGNVRSKTTQITKARHDAGEECTFAVYPAKGSAAVPDGMIVVKRKA